MRQGQGSTSDATNAATTSLPGAPGMMTENPKDEFGMEIEPGTGPLPPGAEDGFDPNVLLEPVTGNVVYKTNEQKTATKTRPAGPPRMLNIYTDGSSLKNGSKIASAGVGVYFGPGDSRYSILCRVFLDSSDTLLFSAGMFPNPSKVTVKQTSVLS